MLCRNSLLVIKSRKSKSISNKTKNFIPIIEFSFNQIGVFVTAEAQMKNGRY